MCIPKLWIHPLFPLSSKIFQVKTPLLQIFCLKKASFYTKHKHFFKNNPSEKVKIFYVHCIEVFILLFKLLYMMHVFMTWQLHV